MKQALILAGGKGTRLSSLFPEIPKPMVPIAGKPVLQYAVENLAKSGITDLHFFTGHKSEIIEEYFGDGKKFGVTAIYHRDTEPQGSAGTVVGNLSKLDEEFLVVYGDTVFNLDISKFIAFHKEHTADATLFVHPNSHPFDSDLVKMDEGGRVRTLHPCPHPADAYLPNMVSAALYVLKKEVLESWVSHKGELDFAHDIIPALIVDGRRVFGYASREYIKDMGTPERLEKVKTDVAAGKLERGSIQTKRPAVFLDRDGTLAREGGYIRQPGDLVLETGADEAVRMINESEYLAVVITNQPVIARGEVTLDGLKEIHNKMEQDLGRRGAYLDAIYYCPHHPDKGFEGERVEYKIACDCRKPGIELIKRAVKDLNIDLERSWFVGDTETDMQAATNATIRSVRVGKEGMTILDAVKFILQNTNS